MHLLRLVNLAILLTAVACGGGGDDGGDDAPIDSRVSDVVEVDCGGATIAATVTTDGLAFDPETTTISVGEVIQFSPAAGHNVVSLEFSVGISEEACFRFDAAGSHEITCTVHDFSGMVIVN
jgi:plastocyanin